MTKKITKIKHNKGLRWPPFDILHATTNQKHVGMTERGWDRPHDRARTLGEHDSKDKPLAEGKDDDEDEYSKDGNILNNDGEYAVGIGGVDEPLDEGDNECDSLSAAPTQACPQLMWLSGRLTL
jgi:hypothetical protein